MPSLLAKPCAASFAFRVTLTFLMIVKASPSTNILLKPNSSAKNTVCKHAHTSAMVEFNTCSFGHRTLSPSGDSHLLTLRFC
ncbi:hypothetical protein Gorai_019525, partial [Gossypium raimondii]|nr:hypothetical protein [Gossypium raimondii]